jgi:hypothetical protein
MSGDFKNGGNFGKIIEPLSCCDPRYNVYDKSGKLKYVIIADCCQCGLICRNSCGKCSEVLFQIHKADKQVMDVNNTDGHIKRLFSGVVQELVSDADNFELIFPVDATPEDKLLLIGNVLMIDYRYYEDGGSNNNQVYY